MLCTDYTLVKYEKTTIRAEPLKCKSWSCEYCQPLRRKRLIREASHGEPTTFITLTVNPAVLGSPDERAQALVSAWRHVRKAACARYGYKKIPFIAIFEKTKRGEPHLHILTRLKWLDQKWLSNMMKELIGAPIVDIRRVDKARNVARYVAKYIGKDPMPFDGCKRYWRSLDWLHTQTRSTWLEDMPKGDIEVWKMSFYEARLALNKQGIPLTPFWNCDHFTVLRRR